MLFLNPVYQQVEQLYADKINHFPLIRLIFLSLDKTIFYLIVYIILRFLYLKFKKRKTKAGKEFKLGIFVTYLLLLFFLTVFRAPYFPWEIHLVLNRPLSDINMIPLVETFKLIRGSSIIDFLYNFYGNILWFIPMGILIPSLTKKRISLTKVALIGAAISISIELLQFILMSGISDIDDVIFNTLGVIIGYCLYQIGKSIKKLFK